MCTVGRGREVCMWGGGGGAANNDSVELIYAFPPVCFSQHFWNSFVSSPLSGWLKGGNWWCHLERLKGGHTVSCFLLTHMETRMASRESLKFLSISAWWALAPSTILYLFNVSKTCLLLTRPSSPVNTKALSVNGFFHLACGYTSCVNCYWHWKSLRQYKY